MSRYDLLPPNTTQLERDLSRATSSLERAGQSVPVIRTAKRIAIPDSVVPWLIYEYGLGEILPYLGNDQRRALAEGVLWQRIRGTPESVRIALSWIGVEGLIEESEGGSARWAEYQLGLSEATSGEEIIDRIVGVSQISSPVRSRLQRIYAVYDYRRFVLDFSQLSDGSPLSDHTGVRPRPDWPQISYGQFLSAQVEADLQVASVHIEVMPVLVKNLDRFLLSYSLLDEDWHTLNHPGVVTDQRGFSADYTGQTWGPVGWADLAWGDVNVIVSSSVQTLSE